MPFRGLFVYILQVHFDAAKHIGTVKLHNIRMWARQAGVDTVGLFKKERLNSRMQ